MNQFLSKLSLYDFLTTIMLGGCLYYGCRINGWFDGILIQPDVIVIGICYIVGFLTHKFVEIIDLSFINKCAGRNVFLSIVLSPLCRNQLSIIRSAMECEELNSDANHIKERYYKAYYNLMIEGKLYNIPNIEAHSAFIKDLIFVFPVIAFSIAYYYCTTDSYVDVALIIIFSIIIEVLLFVTRYITEKKIHTLVWETNKFIKLLRTN